MDDLTQRWILQSVRDRYTYRFQWLGRPIIQFPQDMVAMQEILWDLRPDLVIETGVAQGGSLILYASILELIGGGGRVLGIDIAIGEQSRVAIEGHRLAGRITLVEGDSVAEMAIGQARAAAKSGGTVLVALDSNHTHDHVLKEMELYSPLVTKGSYLVVFDTMLERMSKDFFPDRPWGPGNNPGTAVGKFLETNHRFVVDEEIENRLQITVSPGGYLKCISD